MDKHAAIYDPYLDTLGGGERYCLTVAETLLKSGYTVDLFWSGDQDIVKKAEERFNLELSKVNLVPDIFQFTPNRIECVEDEESITKLYSHHLNRQPLFQRIKIFIKKYQITKKYQLFFYLSDWSVPFMFSQNNLLHVQVPFSSNRTIKHRFLIGIKSLLLKQVICNSNFTNKFASAQFGKKCSVIYPPVDIDKFSPNESKENIILSVGRFDNVLNSKKQDLLINCFKKLSIKNPGWKLILAGGSLVKPDQNSYLQHLKALSEGLPVEFLVNPSFSVIKSAYERSKVYWHAAGFGVEQNVHPENTEHFGMAPVEAMASGSVPIVVDKGGLGEIIVNEQSGFLWNSTEELIAKTQLLIGSTDLLNEMSRAAVIRCKLFSKETFVNNLNKFLI